MNLVDKFAQTEESIVEFLNEKLPHGAGIDSDWKTEVQWSKSRIVAKNSYHCMDEMGYYCGWANFTVVIPLPGVEDFSLHFNGQEAHRLNQKYALKGYLEYTIHHALSTEQ